MQGMDITYTSGSKEEKHVRVTFDPPLLGYEEVKPRMIGMKLDAEESLGMVSRSHSSFLFTVQKITDLIL
jgi:hypothetical protein